MDLFHIAFMLPWSWSLVSRHDPHRMLQYHAFTMYHNHSTLDSEVGCVAKHDTVPCKHYHDHQRFNILPLYSTRIVTLPTCPNNLAIASASPGSNITLSLSLSLSLSHCHL